MLTSCNPFWAFHYAISIVHSVIQRVLPISTSPLPQISIYFALKPLTHPPSYAQLLTVGKYIQCQPGVLSAAREREADQPNYPSYALSGQLPSRKHDCLHSNRFGATANRPHVAIAIAWG